MQPGKLTGGKAELLGLARQPFLSFGVELVMTHIGRIADEERPAVDLRKRSFPIVAQNDLCPIRQASGGQVGAGNDCSKGIDLDSNEACARKTFGGGKKESSGTRSWVDDPGWIEFLG